ncbi:helix-turn-helix transcriptional regulator [Mesorhizobium sp. Z1-4]|uniref:helix-turn-helix transcriptional regulator n=1 Tax=Mesorhizobium sp. Z1-4 TaxID=2448478 RepID=UPI000FD85783|nr:helix-turn-helix transcriptional regulator [Mesorhizobium sp. Z1-4]
MTQDNDTKEWLRAVARYMNMSPSQLALNAGLAASTVTRYLNDGTGTLTITGRSLDKISSYTGIPKHVFPGQRKLPGFGESEAVPYDKHSEERLPAWVEAAIAAHKSNRPGVEPWVMRGWALDLLGVYPGDVLMIDQNRRARAGDVVCAQLTDLATGRAETVMRRFEPPYIVTHSAKTGPSRPEPVDDERVVIMGVEVGIIRPRQ